MYNVDAMGFRVNQYEQIIVFRDQSLFADCVEANGNMEAVVGADPYTQHNFPGIYIAGIKANSPSDK